MENNHLSRPLLTENKHDSVEIFQSSNSTIFIRLSTFLFIGIISIWANFAASTPFQITIFNHIQFSPARNRFNIFYISDDKAIRIIQNSTSFIQNILSPNTHNIRHFTLRLATAATPCFTVTSDGNSHELLINLSVPQIMGDLKKLDYAVKSMVLEGMARIWVLDVGDDGAPPWIVDGVVEYIKRVGGYGDDDDDDDDDDGRAPNVVAYFLQHCESVKNGFIQRLIKGLREDWMNGRWRKL